MKILLIEDDKAQSQQLAEALEAAGHKVSCADDGVAGLKSAKSNTHDVLVIDRMLPKMDGLEIIAALRANGQTTPILILSALGEVDDRVKGLRSGGDDYLVKPVAIEELLARLEILARRASANAGETRIVIGDLVIDLLARKVTRGGKIIGLQGREFRLLEYLARNRGQTVTRAMLLEAVWDYMFDPQTNVIDVHISRLRSKIDKGFDVQLLKTIRGAGYVLDET
ncbi:MAG: response regulator transcription factor [Alphaproteobacteria bacterium]|nr:response regulator transcription factor [Alphaproteobacteria bacterium]